MFYTRYLEVPIERAPKYLITALYWYVNYRNKQNSFYELFMHYLKRAGYLKNGKKKDGKKRIQNSIQTV